MKYQTKTFKNEPTIQTRWNKFNNKIIVDFKRNKDEIKGTKLQNGMTITGIGEKCLKIENNFYNWEDIYNIAIEDEETDDTIMKEIINYIFEDSKYNKDNDEYKARKFEVTENFEDIKEEILNNKQHYITETITGIGEKSIKIGYGYDAEYMKWETLEKIVEDAKTHTFTELSKLVSWRYIDTFKQLFNENKEVYTKQDLKLLEKGEHKLLQLYRMYRRGELTYTKIQEISDNDKEVAEILEKVFKWTRGRAIPFEYRRGKVYSVVEKEGSLLPYMRDDNLTEDLHKKGVQDYYVAQVPPSEREWFVCSQVYSHDVESIVKPCCRIIKLHNSHLYYLNEVIDYFKMKGLLFAYELDDDERYTRNFTFYNDDNEEFLDETEKIATDLLVYHLPSNQNPFIDFEEDDGAEYSEDVLEEIFQQIKWALDEIPDKDYDHDKFMDALSECTSDYRGNGREFIADYSWENILRYYWGDD